MIMCFTEDAYKQAISTHTPLEFKDRGFFQVDIDESVLVKKMAGYKVNADDKKIRIIRPILDENRIVRDISMVTSITKDGVVWDRG